MSNNNKYVFIIDSSIISANRILNAVSQVANIFKVEYAASGKEAIQKIINNPPNTVLMDIQLPDINGAEILSQIMKMYPKMRVIVLTEYPTAFSFKVCKELGALGYYDKVSELNMAIEKLQELVK